MTRQFWQARTALVRVGCLAVTILMAAAGAWHADGADPTKPLRRRASAPTSWDRAASSTFFDDAFVKLDGERPSFAAAADAGRTTDASAAPATPTAGGFAWSKLVSEETLTDEIKDQRAVVAAAAAKPTDFKGGGYEQAREAFSAIALCFAVIADYDQGIRWKKDAAFARDLFARVGFNCKAGTDQSFKESQARLDDLAALLDGNAPAGRPDRDEDFLWSQVAGRPSLMNRLETAEATLAAGLGSRGEFDRSRERLVRDAELVAVIGEAIHRPDFEDHDDDTYRGHATGMRDAAVRLRDACSRKDYDAARRAADEIKKSCDDCHGDYRG